MAGLTKQVRNLLKAKGHEMSAMEFSNKIRDYSKQVLIPVSELMAGMRDKEEELDNFIDFISRSGYRKPAKLRAKSQNKRMNIDSDQIFLASTSFGNSSSSLSLDDVDTITTNNVSGLVGTSNSNSRVYSYTAMSTSLDDLQKMDTNDMVEKIGYLETLNTSLNIELGKERAYTEELEDKLRVRGREINSLQNQSKSAKSVLKKQAELKDKIFKKDKEIKALRSQMEGGEDSEKVKKLRDDLERAKASRDKILSQLHDKK